MASTVIPKKFINEPSTVVEEMLDGLCALHTHLARLHPYQVVVRRECLDAPLDRVAVISGGGSGHEPMAGGFVGRGLLAAAVAGGVFASPNIDSVLAAILACASKEHGALLVVLQYTGDRLCFGAAAAIARSMGYPVEMVLVGDDCSLLNDDSHAGRRGLCGITFVLKIAGALAEAGWPLSEVKKNALQAAGQVRTYGVASSPCTLPGTTSAIHLGENEIELGLGIHGERGVQRGPMQPANELVALMLTRIVPEIRAQLVPGSSQGLALAINGLGGTPLMELLIIAREVTRILEEKEKLLISITMCGNIVTSLECHAGAAKLDSIVSHPMRWLVLTPGFPRIFPRSARMQLSGTVKIPALTSTASTPSQPEVPHLRACVEAVCSALLANKDYLTKLDQVVGDADLGISLATAAAALQADMPLVPLHSIAETLRAASAIVRKAIGGTSGPLYTVALNAAASASTGPEPAAAVSTALRAAAEAISTLGGAERGHRTMLDALIPAAEAVLVAGESAPSLATAFQRAARAAHEGAEKTAQMLPRKGRSSYLGERALGHPDPGAVAVALQLDAITNALIK